MAKMYCPICERSHFVNQIIKTEKFTYKGQVLKCSVRVYRCKNTPLGKGDFEDGSMLDKNLASMRKAIKKFKEGKKACQN